MSNSLKAIFLSVAAVVVMGICGLYFVFSRQANYTANLSVESVENLFTNLRESEYELYDGKEVTGTAVMECIRNLQQLVGFYVVTDRGMYEYPGASLAAANFESSENYIGKDTIFECSMDPSDKMITFSQVGIGRTGHFVVSTADQQTVVDAIGDSSLVNRTWEEIIQIYQDMINGWEDDIQQLINDYDVKVEELDQKRDQLYLLNQQASDLEDAIRDGYYDSIYAQSEYEDVERQIAAIEAQLSALEEQLNDQRATASELEQEVQDLQDQYNAMGGESLIEELNQWAAQREELNAELEALKRASIEAAEEYTRLEQDLLQAQIDLESVKSDLEAAELVEAGLEAELTRVEQERDTAQDWRERYNAARVELEELLDRRGTTESSLASFIPTDGTGHTHTDQCRDGHVHTDDCYEYHRHTSSCYRTETSGTMCGGALGSAHSFQYTFECTQCHQNTLNYSYAWVPCLSCGHSYNSYDLYYCSNCGYNQVQTYTVPSSCTNYPTTQVLICDKTEGNNVICGIPAGSGDIVCNEVVISVEALAPQQAIELGGNLNTAAKLTFLDGHTEARSLTANGFNNGRLGIQTVSLVYSGKVDSATTEGQKSATISVIVVEGLK